MLNRTVFQAGAPVAVAVATPNPATAFATIHLDGSGSFHQDPAKHIVKWDWDINHDGVFELHGAQVTTSYPAVGTYPVTLQVTDDGTPPATASTIITILVSTPPIAPTANAGGPYDFCPQAKPWFVDGSKSVNPDDGKHDPGAPGDFIKSYLWDLTGGTTFPNPLGSSGVTLDVTSYFTTAGTGNYLVDLQVTDNTALSFPSSGQPDLTGTKTAQVHVLAATDPICTSGCINNLSALAKNKQVQLTWALVAGADHYNVYRSQVNGGPYTQVGTATKTQTVYFDYTVTNGQTYYYVVRPAALSGVETCQSNQVSAAPKLTR
jgi:hypothetical protein